MKYHIAKINTNFAVDGRIINNSFLIMKLYIPIVPIEYLDYLVYLGYDNK